MEFFTKLKSSYFFLVLLASILINQNLFSQTKWIDVGTLHGRSNQSIKFIDAQTSIVVGGLSLTNEMARYVNRGTFLDQYFDTDTTRWQYMDVSFPSHDVGYIVGWGGAVIKTNNALNSYHYIRRYLPQADTIYNYSGVYFTSVNEGYIVGGNETTEVILKTSDGGYTWTEQRKQSGSWLNSVYFTSATNGIAVGSNGKILKTTNGGATWSVVTIAASLATRDFKRVIFTNSTTGFIVGGIEDPRVQTILKTTDGGTSWIVSMEASGQPILNGIAFRNSTTAYAVGNNGAIKLSTDGGNNWSNLVLPDSINDTVRHLKCVTFFDNYTGAFGGEWGKYFVYNDSIPYVATPSVRTDSAIVNETSHTAILYGAINPLNYKAHARFEFGLNNTFTNILNVVPDTLTGNAFQSVSVTSPTLPSGIYSYRLRGSSTAGDSVGVTKTFSIGIPEVVTGGIYISPEGKVKLTGSVNPNNGSVSVFFEYGTSPSFGNTKSYGVISGSTLQNVSVITPALTPGIYYYRVYVTSAVGTFYGQTLQFYTGPNPIPNFDFEYWNTDTVSLLDNWVYMSVHEGLSYDGSKSVIIDGNDSKDGFGLILQGGVGDGGPSGGTPSDCEKT